MISVMANINKAVIPLPIRGTMTATPLAYRLSRRRITRIETDACFGEDLVCLDNMLNERNHQYQPHLQSAGERR